MRNLLYEIRKRVEHLAGEVAFSFSGREHGAEASPAIAAPTGAPSGAGDFQYSYGDLDREARGHAPALAALQRPDQPLLILLPPGPDYIIAFFACLYADRIAVPAPPPVMERNLDRLRSIVRDLGARRVLVNHRQRERFRRRFEADPLLGALEWITLDELIGGAYREPRPDPDRVALLQYTSGSTADARGVMITHRNLLSNSEAIHRRFRTDRNTSGVFWLPPHHDMGLVGAILHPVLIGGRSHLMTPHDFLKNPLAWLEEISNRGASISGAPNFAYDLCARRLEEMPAPVSLDLSAWRLAFCGAEPVLPQTLDRFARACSRFGFQRRAFVPCYGLAEATLLVSAPEQEEQPLVAAFSRSDLEQGRVVARDDSEDDPPDDATGDSSPDHSLLVGLGRPADCEVILVDPDRRIQLEPNLSGEIWVRGPAVAPGYFNQPEPTARAFDVRLAVPAGDAPDEPASKGYLRTGDLGFFYKEQLFVYGRRKDLLILRGRNIAPAELERSALELLRLPGDSPPNRSSRVLASCAAFALGPGDLPEAAEPVGTEERIYVLLESEDGPAIDPGARIKYVRAGLVTRFGLPISRVVLVRPGALPRTTSGKIQRFRCREQYLKGEIKVLADG